MPIQRISRQLGSALRHRRSATIDHNRIAFVLGMQILVLTVFMLPPAATDLSAGNPDWQIFFGSACAKCVRTASLKVWRDDQVIAYTKIVVTVIVGLSVWYMAETGASAADSFRIVSLNAVSVITTTGFAVGDYTLWAPGAPGFFFLLMFLGGCSGSTTGGIKTFRLQIMAITAANYLKRLISPSRVVYSSYGSRKITGDVSAAVLAFVSVMFATVMLFTVALSFFDLDFVTSLSAATTAVANVGPGLGTIIGPAGNFSSLPDGAKILLSIAMLLGRLEFFTVLVVFSRDFWR